MTGRVFTIKTVLSDYFQGAIGETKLREAIRQGKIPCAYIGARIILREETLDAWFSKQEESSTNKDDRPCQLVKKRA